jgi:hypothetical protein
VLLIVSSACGGVDLEREFGDFNKASFQVEEFWSWGTSLGELHPGGSLKLQISWSSKLEGFRDQRRLRASKHSKHLFFWAQSHPKDWDFQDGHVDKRDFLSTAGLIRNELGR